MAPYDLYLLEIDPDNHKLVSAKLYSDTSQIIAHYRTRLEMGDGFFSQLHVDHIPEYFPLEIRRDFAYPYNLVLFRGTDIKEFKAASLRYLKQIERYPSLMGWEMAERAIILARHEAERFVKDNDVEDTNLLLTYLANVLTQWQNDWREMLPRMTLIPIATDADVSNARDAGVRWIPTALNPEIEHNDVLGTLTRCLVDDIEREH